jgi:hypothetical protein
MIASAAIGLTMALGQSVVGGQISPFIAFSRIEDKSSLSLAASRSVADSSPRTLNTVKTFDLLRYSNLMLGSDFAFAKVTFSDLNLNLHLHVGGGFFRTPIDSIYDSTSKALLLRAANLLSWYITPELVVQPIHSDRIEYDLRYGLVYSKLFDRKPLESGAEILQVINGDYIHRIQFNFNIFTNPSDRGSWLFLRATVFANGTDSNISLQAGYSTSISKLLSSN